MKRYKPTITQILTLITLFSCEKDEPDIDYSNLIVGKWNETKAIDSFTDFVNASESKQKDVTNKMYSIAFKENSEFTLSKVLENLDSGEYYFSDFENKKYLTTYSIDNIRTPKTFNIPNIQETFQVVEITTSKLVLKSTIMDAIDADSGKLRSRREFVWELTRQ